MHPVDAMCKWKHEKILDIDEVMEVSVKLEIAQVVKLIFLTHDRPILLNQGAQFLESNGAITFAIVLQHSTLTDLCCKARKKCQFIGGAKN